MTQERNDDLKLRKEVEVERERINKAEIDMEVMKRDMLHVSIGIDNLTKTLDKLDNTLDDLKRLSAYTAINGDKIDKLTDSLLLFDNRLRALEKNRWISYGGGIALLMLLSYLGVNFTPGGVF